MRINYYEFPDTVDAQTRYKNGAVNNNGICGVGRKTCIGCIVCEDGWHECVYYRCTDSEFKISGIAIMEVKNLIREFGGRGYILHCDRNGNVFETTPITLKGNNSKFKYNQHL